MSYAMCLDNSWDVMCEEEMYDVNGGWSPFRKAINQMLDGFYTAIGVGLAAFMGYSLLDGIVAAKNAAKTVSGVSKIVQAAKAFFWDWKVIASLVAAAIIIITTVFLYNQD